MSSPIRILITVEKGANFNWMVVQEGHLIHLESRLQFSLTCSYGSDYPIVWLKCKPSFKRGQVQSNDLDQCTFSCLLGKIQKFVTATSECDFK